MHKDKRFQPLITHKRREREKTMEYLGGVCIVTSFSFNSLYIQELRDELGNLILAIVRRLEHLYIDSSAAFGIFCNSHFMCM